MNKRIVSFVVVAALFPAFASTAYSQELREPTSAELDRGEARPPRMTEGAEPRFKRLAIEGNPLSLFIGRYSANVEFLPALHHAIVVNPHYDSVSFDTRLTVGTDEELSYREGFSGFGAELGYRYYTGREGPNGFFVGPSFLFGFYDARSDIAGIEEKSFTSVGWAIDIGGQGVIGPGIVLGGGFGIQQTRNSINADQYGELPLAAEILVGSGVRPRFLFSIGYAFN